MRHRLFLLSSRSSISMNLETSMELKKIATIKDDPKTMDSVIGKKIMNSPIVPGQKPKGRKAAMVVAVEMMIG